jgi:hypothetical protein
MFIIFKNYMYWLNSNNRGKLSNKGCILHNRTLVTYQVYRVYLLNRINKTETAELYEVNYNCFIVLSNLRPGVDGYE